MTWTYPIPNPQALCAKIVAAGGPSFDPSQPTGSFETHGYHFSYDIAGGNITITLLDEVSFVVRHIIAGKLDGFFKGE